MDSPFTVLIFFFVAFNQSIQFLSENEFVNRSPIDRDLDEKVSNFARKEPSGNEHERLQWLSAYWHQDCL